MKPCRPRSDGRKQRFALPALAHTRVLRTWTGFEPHVDDFYPLAGPLPGVADAFVLACVRGGYTIGPCLGTLVGERILDREPELPLFDPARVLATPASTAPAAAASS